MASSAADGLRLLRLEHAVARLLAEAPGSGVEEALLEAVGSSLEWDHCAVWAAGRETGSSSAAPRGRPLSAPRLDAFEALTRELRLGTGEGLPGRVWESGTPGLDRRRDPRPQLPACGGGRGGGPARRPLLSDHRPRRARSAVVEVMTTPSRASRTPTCWRRSRAWAARSAASSSTGVAEAAVRENEARLRATLDAALDAIITMDHRGAGRRASTRPRSASSATRPRRRSAGRWPS